MHRTTTALALVSSALIGFQLALMQVLSIAQWYHFAYMVISVALLGFGASGTVISLARSRLLRRFNFIVPLAMLSCGAAMPTAVWLSQSNLARFDSYLLLTDPSQLGSLLATYLLFFIPFFLGALAVGLILVRFSKEAGTYYFANLLGSGLGALGALGLMWLLAPPLLPPAIGLMAVLSGIVVIPRRYRHVLLPSAAAAALVCAVFFARPVELAPSQYKDLSTTLDLPGARIAMEESSPYGLVQVVSAPALRYAPGLSLTYRGDIPVRSAVFNNGNWYGPVTAATDTTHLLDYTTAGLPYAIGPRSTVLDLHARTGGSVAHAVTRGVRRIAAIEPHESVISLLRTDLAAETDSLFHREAVTVHLEEPRTFLAAQRDSFSLITQPIVGAFGGTLGLFALQEQYGMTLEAFESMWHHLEGDGVISATSWLDYPYRNSLKLLATLVRTLRDAGIEEPHRHIAAVRSWGTVTFVVRPRPLDDADVAAVRAFAETLSFDPLLLPGIRREERMRHHVLEDTTFFTYVDRILAGDRAVFSTYEFDIEPTTDDRPYFSQFLKWRTVPRIMDALGEASFPFIELGTLITAATFVQIFVIAILLIVIPLFRRGWEGKGRWWTLIYFACLGIGYLFVEMVLIQRFVLYLGHPIYAIAAVLAAVLLFSGLGSSVSQRIQARPAVLATAAGLVAAVVLLYVWLLMPFLRATIALPLLLKGPISLLVVGIPAFLMGMPFPFGLRWLTLERRSHVPWAWAINGCFSVVSTALAALLAVEMGFVFVMSVAAGAYVLAALVSIRA